MIFQKLIPVATTKIKRPGFTEFAAALSCVACFAVFKFLTTELLEEGSIQAAATPFLVLAICLFYPGTPSASVAPASRILCRVVAVMLGFYALTAVVTYPTGLSHEADLALGIVRFLPLVALISAILTFWYPSFVLVAATVILAQKEVSEDLFKIRISHTDYLAVVEIGLLLGIASILLARGGRWAYFKPERSLFNCNVKAASILVVMIGIGAHFSNYFYSGIQKMALDGGLMFWALHNPTYALSINAWIGGFYPLSSWPKAAATVLELSTRSHVLLNILILVAQLAAVVFIVKRIAMIGVTLFYDLTHVVIFFLTGIFFWKWIILNLALVAAMRRLPTWVETRSVAVLSIAAVLFAPFVFGVVWLGWYDTRALVVSETYAVTKSGEVVRVPSNYFGTISVTAAQHRLGRSVPGHFPTVTWGTTQTSDDLTQANSNCSFETDETIRFNRSPEKTTATIQLTHLYAMQREARDGWYSYDLYPHHIWSNPLMSRDFGNIAISDIDHYIYRVRSGCVSMDEDGPVFEERKTDEFIVPIPKGGFQ